MILYEENKTFINPHDQRIATFNGKALKSEGKYEFKIEWTFEIGEEKEFFTIGHKSLIDCISVLYSLTTQKILDIINGWYNQPIISKQNDPTS
jgi:hypothetical protein